MFFSYNVSLEQARAALAALVLHEFKDLEHPLTPTSAALIPSCLQGAQSSAVYVAPLLNIPLIRLMRIIDDYDSMYRNQMQSRARDFEPSPLNYNV